MLTEQQPQENLQPPLDRPFKARQSSSDIVISTDGCCLVRNFISNIFSFAT